MVQNKNNLTGGIQIVSANARTLARAAMAGASWWVRCGAGGLASSGSLANPHDPHMILTWSSRDPHMMRKSAWRATCLRKSSWLMLNLNALFVIVRPRFYVCNVLYFQHLPRISLQGNIAHVLLAEDCNKEANSFRSCWVTFSCPKGMDVPRKYIYE